MNFLKRGPELKLSEIKVPSLLQDVYYDLKDRHLLPVAIVLIVAIVAVPIVLSQSGSEATEAGETGGAGAAASTATAAPGELVSKSAPGLRDYRRRLDRLRAKDPFVQQYPEQVGEGGTGEGGAEPSTETSSGSSSSEETPSAAPTSPSTETEAPGEPNPERLTYYSYAIDVRVSAGGSAGGGSKGGDEPSVRRNLPELTMLPSRETPALVYMGSTKDGKKALMLVSSDVKALFGDAKCVLGSESCELLALEPGLPETIVYGNAGKTYKVELIQIHLVKTKDLNRAPLGKPHGSNSQPHPHGQRLAVGEEAQLPGR